MEFCSLSYSAQLQEMIHICRKTRFVERDDYTDTRVPAPLQPANDAKKPSKHKVAAVVGGVGSTLLVLLTGFIVYFCLMRLRRLARRTSDDSASSVASPPGEGELGGGSIPLGGVHGLRQLTLAELENATRNFNDGNILGQGSFGMMYRGLLDDGSVVAIKRRKHSLVPQFVNKVRWISEVRDKHIVKLIGYCEENDEQLLVYDYLHCGNVGNHLYDSEGGLPIGKLDMKQRIGIALGAAKGLQHLHGLVPPLFHMHFRTKNVLLDEKFVAKVSDFGVISILLGDRGESSSKVDHFRDPELRHSNENFSERSDVYSFGVFLLELISGREDENIVSQARELSDVKEFVDKTIVKRMIDDGVVEEMMRLALVCVGSGLERPKMEKVVEQLERILEREVGPVRESGKSEEIGLVTLGSELFK